MEIHADAHVPFARPAVFAVYRDDMTKLLPYLPNVRSIEVKSRRDEGAIAEIVNEWRGGGEIPAAIRAVLSESALAWTDTATWDANAFRCAWRTETHAFQGAVRSSGENVFLEDGPGGTLIQFRGSLEVDAKKIRGVPGFLASTVGKSAEEFLVTRVKANLLETARAVAKSMGKG
jgi:hypothetical protein